jgi:7-keto-8-aminopelargonate synthetase-like enzyme
MPVRVRTGGWGAWLAVMGPTIGASRIVTGCFSPNTELESQDLAAFFGA